MTGDGEAAEGGAAVPAEASEATLPSGDVAPGEPGGPAPSKPGRPVVDHLLFHKAIIEDDGDPGRFDRYVELAMAQSTDAMENPLDRAFYHLFDVVVKENMDPWRIDLSGFAKEYMKRLRGSEMDFIVAGRVICLAYQILELKSDDLALRATAEEEKAREPVWDVPAFFDEPLDVDYTGKVLAGELPLVPPLAESATRPVSLMELVDALEEARAEAEVQMRIAEYRRTHRQAPAKADLRGKIHDENITDDILATWERIKGAKGGSLSFREAHAESREDMVTVFLSLLFLAKMRKIRIEQRELPRGDISITLLERELDVVQSAQEHGVVLMLGNEPDKGKLDMTPAGVSPKPVVSVEVTR